VSPGLSTNSVGATCTQAGAPWPGSIAWVTGFHGFAGVHFGPMAYNASLETK